MTRWIVSGLVVLNVLLGVGVYNRLGVDRPAQAQIGGGGGEYAVVSGYNNNQTILYIMEVASGKLAVVRADPTNKRIEGVTTGSVADDLNRIR